MTDLAASSFLPDAQAFAARLFGRSAAEDVAQYSPIARAWLAEQALTHLARPRTDGSARIFLTDPPTEAGPALAGVTVLEVINPNSPFLLDSTLAELVEQGLTARLVAHPILHVERDAQGALQAIHLEDGAAGSNRESLIHIHLPRLSEARKEVLREALGAVYGGVHLAVSDWRAMRARVHDMALRYKADPPPLPDDEIAEALKFLEWLGADNFTFLGLCDYHFTQSPRPGIELEAVAGEGLGLLREGGTRVLQRGGAALAITPEIMAFLHQPQALVITKANMRSRVHRRVHMDYIGVKLFDAQGKLSGELRIVGLFTSTAYTRSTQTIPYIRHKIACVIDMAELDPASHSGKALMNVLEEYPRDDLFQIDVQTLAAFAQDIVQLYERPRVRVLARPDRFDRFVSALVYVPRDRYDSTMRQRIGEYLARIFHGRVSAAVPFYPEGPLVRTQFIIGRNEGTPPQVDRQVLENEIAAIVRTWPDALSAALLKTRDKGGEDLSLRYGQAFEPAYANAFSAQAAIADIDIIERLTPDNPRASVFYGKPGDQPEEARLKVFSLHDAMPLSQRVPLIEHMGFRVISEDTYEIKPQHGARIWLHDMILSRASGQPLDIASVKPSLEALLDALFRGFAESDGYNALCIEAGLAWRDIAMLRALSRYIQQTSLGYSQDYMWRTMARHSAIAAQLVALFHARFDPRQGGDAAAQEPIASQIEAQLADVASLDEDRILRAFLTLIGNGLRTNFFQSRTDGLPGTVISFKFDSGKIDFLPLPRPLYEISVYSPRVEGIHLRFGKVARGGLRWSDRPQDFRTEILGLVKAQQVKNAVIVPVGAKGGFVHKQLPPPADREAFMAEGVAAYRIFIEALLDLTDNLVEGKIVPPPQMVRHDGDDPYLVVAADKGTASFSDIANAISLEHGHWLGDAFASGGSAGYDHKKMGITARGAWEAVKRHFREMDVNIQKTPFTCAGVGDMSGDVFGNGMMLSPATRLVAAFDHRDIFIDPSPDASASLAERKRLFALPRSSWQDYDKSLISEGGGVFSRSAKSIALSPQAQAALGFDEAEATPQAIMSAILRAPVDLLWFGGIGTYVKASAESHADAGDRANDSIRVNGAELRCKVIGEGANLGMTQRGRVEAAQHGARLDTDAIDNSAGVNSSDIEVNIKIALAEPVRQGLLDANARKALLASMTQDVAALVLRNNYQQTLALSLAQRGGARDIGLMRALMHKLEGEGRLNRAVEYLPDDAALSARARDAQGLTRPELAVLLAYAKLSLHDSLLDSDLPDDPWLAGELTRYFPPALTRRFPEAIAHHALRREIIATTLSNALINRGGPAIVSRIMDETDADAARIARAFIVVREIFQLVTMHGAIDALDNRVSGALQLQLYDDVRRLTLRQMVWFARHESFAGKLETTIARYRRGMDELALAIHEASPQDARTRMEARAAELQAAGVDRDLAHRIVALDAMGAGPDIILVAEQSGASIADVAATYYATEDAFGIDGLTRAAAAIALADLFERSALNRALAEVAGARRTIVARILEEGGAGADRVAAWIAARGDYVARRQRQIAEIAGGGLTLARVSVAGGLLGEIAGQPARKSPEAMTRA